ncbi:hypothetical protein [Pantoea sp. SS70]|uniref:NACHT domain-containing protein n=1 Tax=Pantoea sp. SS70 TaxID=3024247 RepID=UPI002452AF9E|nr:hypothetical protein [Pantoea sp. SS70]WGK59378.1 hypothetical protein PO881_22100 [Pantoea sp. SS70]
MITLENAIELAKPWALQLFNEKILPFLMRKGSDLFEKEKNLYKVKCQSLEFLSKTRAQCSLVNSLAFPNVLKKVSEIYEPLTLSSLDSLDSQDIKVHRGDFVINAFDHILIIDNAGMGKSTLLKKMVTDTVDFTDYIPIYVELRTLKDESIKDQLLSIIGLSGNNQEQILTSLPFAFFFDGIDEIPFDIKNNVIRKIRAFSEEFIHSKIIITSRPDQSLLDLHTYNRFKIKPLEIEESYSLLRIYDSNSSGYKGGLSLSKKLISEIKGMRVKDHGTILEFLTTPLYVSLLFCSYKFKPVIPRRKDLFYSQVFEALFETHDLSKEIGYVRRKHSGLDITEFSLILRRLAFWCLKNKGVLEFTRSQLENVISEITDKITGIKVKPLQFIKDLIYSVPLFVKEGSLYRWSHKSLMEYFCAEFICVDIKDGRDTILLKMYESNSPEHFKNIIELCSDLDFSSFRKVILNKCLNDYFIHMNSISGVCHLSENDKSIWACITFFSDLKLMLTPYCNANLGDFDIHNKDTFTENSFEHNFIGFRDYITHITFPISLKSTVFEIFRWKSPESFFSETEYYNRRENDLIKLPENTVIEGIKGGVKGCDNNAIQDIISVFLQFRHSLLVPVIHSAHAQSTLDSIRFDASNGVNDLLAGF